MMKHYLSVVVLISLSTILNGCDEYEWYPVDSYVQDVTLVYSSETLTTTHSTDPSGSVSIEARIKSGQHGCNKESHVFAYISDYIDKEPSTKWEKIRYTLQFWDASACWSILGDTYYGNYPDRANFDDGLIEFDINNENDKILSNTLFYGSFKDGEPMKGSYNGERKRCDNNDDNFWYSGNLAYPNLECNILLYCYMGALRVEQRRDPNSYKAGIGIGFTCSGQHTKVRISSIEVGY